MSFGNGALVSEKDVRPDEVPFLCLSGMEESVLGIVSEKLTLGYHLKVMNLKYQDYLNTDYWKEVTNKVKSRAGWKCQVCNSPHDLNAHHRTYEHRGNEMNYLDDLICMCRRCHAIFHGKREESIADHQPAIPPIKITNQKVWKKRKQRTTSWLINTDKYNHESDIPAGEPITLTL